MLLIPTSKLSGSGAVNVLLSLAAMVYRNTLPPGAAPAASAAAGSPSSSG